MDSLPPEILIQVFKQFDDYTVLTRLRPVCKSFGYATAILIPSLKISGLTPALWEKVFSHIKSYPGSSRSGSAFEFYRSLHHISQTSPSFHSLLRETKLPLLQAATFRLPTNDTSTDIINKDASKKALVPVNVLEHPAFENICCRIELGGLIYHKTGSGCPSDLLTFPVAKENATNPPLTKVLVRFSARYGVKLRPVLISKEDAEGNAHGKSVTVGDVYYAMRRLFAEPLTEKQHKALKELREWELKKHEAVKKAVSKMERQASSPSAAEESTPDSNNDAAGYDNMTESQSSNEKAPEPLREPVIEHDESFIRFEEPVSSEASNPHGGSSSVPLVPPNTGEKTPRQREFLRDFPYVYASAHTGNLSEGIQEFVLTYH